MTYESLQSSRQLLKWHYKSEFHLRSLYFALRLENWNRSIDPFSMWLHIFIFYTNIINRTMLPSSTSYYYNNNNCDQLLCGSVVTALLPTQKHHYATAKNVEFGSLILHQMTALLAKRFAGNTNLLLLLLLLLIALACAA